MQTTIERPKSDRKNREPRVEPAERLLGLDDLAEIMGLSRRTVERMRAAGELPRPMIVGKRTARWKRSTIDAWVERRQAAR